MNIEQQAIEKAVLMVRNHEATAVDVVIAPPNTVTLLTEDRMIPDARWVAGVFGVMRNGREVVRIETRAGWEERD